MNCNTLKFDENIREIKFVFFDDCILIFFIDDEIYENGIDENTVLHAFCVDKTITDLSTLTITPTVVTCTLK